MKYLLLISLLIGQTAFASIKIDADEDACLGVWISMDVDVTVDDETFSYSPGCRFSLDDSFKTSKGTECVVDAGMCSPFSPQKRFEVSCSDGSRNGIDIQCLD